jgi:lambda repressor-like predicted transcriptional regulator
MNEALDNALRKKGITAPKDFQRFALGIGMSDRTLRRWLDEETVPNEALGRLVARRLGVKYDDLWPKETAA